MHHRISRANPRTSQRKGGNAKETAALVLLVREHEVPALRPFDRLSTRCR
jgi:hypothetical protein